MAMSCIIYLHRPPREFPVRVDIFCDIQTTDNEAHVKLVLEVHNVFLIRHK